MTSRTAAALLLSILAVAAGIARTSAAVVAASSTTTPTTANATTESTTTAATSAAAGAPLPDLCSSVVPEVDGLDMSATLPTDYGKCLQVEPKFKNQSNWCAQLELYVCTCSRCSALAAAPLLAMAVCVG
jgi:hypothetical protein